MGTSKRTIAIRRGLSLADQKYLQEQMPSVDKICEGTNLRWYDLGRAACDVITKWDYKRAFHGLSSISLTQESGTLPRRVRQYLMSEGAAHPTERSSLTVPVTSVIFHGNQKYVGVAYVLDSPELDAENQRLRTFLDSQNGTQGNWPKEYEPIVQVATTLQVYATGPEIVANRILDAFGDVAPESFTLEKPQIFAS